MEYIRQVVTLKLDAGLCIQCKKCLEVCPRGVFEFDQVLKIRALDQCIECGGCSMNCPTKALSVEAGVGCASAIISSHLKKFKLLKRFLKKDCC